MFFIPMMSNQYDVLYMCVYLKDVLMNAYFDPINFTISFS